MPTTDELQVQIDALNQQLGQLSVEVGSLPVLPEFLNRYSQIGEVVGRTEQPTGALPLFDALLTVYEFAPKVDLYVEFVVLPTRAGCTKIIVELPDWCPRPPVGADSRFASGTACNTGTPTGNTINTSRTRSWIETVDGSPVGAENALQLVIDFGGGSTTVCRAQAHVTYKTESAHSE